MGSALFTTSLRPWARDHRTPLALRVCAAALFLCLNLQSQEISLQFTRAGELHLGSLGPDQLVVLESTPSLTGEFAPLRSFLPGSASAQADLSLSAPAGFFRARIVDVSPTREGFTNLLKSFGTLTTIAGKGENTAAVNAWQPQYENQSATQVELSRPHIAMASTNGHIFIADKNAHAIRKILPNGTIITVAGTGVAGNGPEGPAQGLTVALNEPNGLWVSGRGIAYILDLGNGKIRKLGPNGQVRTVFTVPGGINSGRGLWVQDDETLAYVSSGTELLKWTPADGVTVLASGFAQLGNLAIHPEGDVVVTDRNAHRVYRVDSAGNKTVIAGNGTTSGGGDGALATETGLNQVRAIWTLPNGAYFLGTDAGSQLWYVDRGGRIHLMVHGSAAHAHAGDGEWFYSPVQPRLSKIRQVTMDHEGNLLVTEHDAGFVRRVAFRPLE